MQNWLLHNNDKVICIHSQQKLFFGVLYETLRLYMEAKML